MHPLCLLQSVCRIFLKSVLSICIFCHYIFLQNKIGIDYIIGFYYLKMSNSSESCLIAFVHYECTSVLLFWGQEFIKIENHCCCPRKIIFKNGYCTKIKIKRSAYDVNVIGRVEEGIWCILGGWREIEVEAWGCHYKMSSFSDIRITF